MYTGYEFDERQSLPGFLDRAAQAQLRLSVVCLGDVEPHRCVCGHLITTHERAVCNNCEVMIVEEIESMPPAEQAYILESDCTCHHSQGQTGDRVEHTCERCSLERATETIPY